MPIELSHTGLIHLYAYASSGQLQCILMGSAFADLRGGIRGSRTPPPPPYPGVQIHSISCSFREILAPPPPRGNSGCATAEWTMKHTYAHTHARKRQFILKFTKFKHISTCSPQHPIQ